MHLDLVFHEGRILFVEDNEEIAEVILLELEETGYDVTYFGAAEQDWAEFEQVESYGSHPEAYDLVITDVDASKRIAIIKVVRGLTSLGLKEAKDAVTNLPFTILEGKTKGEVEEAMKELEAGGAKCEMK